MITYEKAIQAIETLIKVCEENDCSDCPIQNTCSHFLCPIHNTSHFIVYEPYEWQVID